MLISSIMLASNWHFESEKTLMYLLTVEFFSGSFNLGVIFSELFVGRLMSQCGDYPVSECHFGLGPLRSEAETCLLVLRLFSDSSYLKSLVG